jgi:hypothetical protein
MRQQRQLGCTSCGNELLATETYCHPLLRAPICFACLGRIKKTENGQEREHCVWCGLSKDSHKNSIPEYVACSSCEAKFCIYCLTRNFGEYEMSKMAFDDSMSWRCLLCDPSPLERLGRKNHWKKYHLRMRVPRNSKKNLILEDLSLGREPIAIPCINDFDGTVPQSFTYVTEPIPGNTSALKRNPNFLSCCSCVDNCRDPTRCECARLMGGFAYDQDGILVREQSSGIYECNDLCSCHRSRCQNRVVSVGTQLKLQVFKCAENGKGWGVRTPVDIPAGTYVTSYLGEILNESDCELRGIKHGDEYLFGLDAWGRSRGCRRLDDLGLKPEQQSRHQVLCRPTLPAALNSTVAAPVPSEDIETALFTPLFPGLSAASMTQDQISSLLGASLFDRICQSNAVLRCSEHVILCGGKKDEVEKDRVSPDASESISRSGGGGRQLTLQSCTGEKRKFSQEKLVEEYGAFLPCRREYKSRWLNAWQEARSTISDRVQLETETKDNTFTIDAK